MKNNAAEKTIFTIYGNGGKIDSFEVESGNVISSSISNSTIRLCVVPDGTKKYKTEEISDIYATITVYCKNDGKWYKDSCRLHCIYATDKSWWDNPKNTKNIKVNLD